MTLKDAYADRHEPEALRVVARAYWALLIVVVLVTTVLATGYGIWEFSQTPSPDDSLAGIRPQPAFTRVQLEELLKQFDARGVRFEERMKASVGAKDPS